MLEELKGLIPKSIRGWILFLVVMIWTPQIVYDFFVKPGLSSTGEFLVRMVSLASAQLRDSVYATAALDPTTGAAQSIHQLLFLGIPSLVFGIFLAERVSSRRARPSSVQTDTPQERSVEELEARQKHLNKLLWKLELSLAAILLLVTVLGTYQVASQKKSTQIWLNFNADVRILAPKVTELQIKELQAQFAAIKTKAEYLGLQDKLRSLQGLTTVPLRSLEKN